VTAPASPSGAAPLARTLLIVQPRVLDAKECDMFNDGRDGTGFTTGVVVGALVGAGVALLFAPKAGDELRSDLNGSMTSLREAVARRYRALAEMAGVEVEHLEERVDRVAESIESGARDVLEAAGAARRRGPRASGSQS